MRPAHSLALTLLTVAACSSSGGGGSSGGSSGGGNPADPFRGAWTVQSGNSTVTCGPAPVPTDGGYSLSNRVTTTSYMAGQFSLVFDETGPTSLAQEIDYCTEGDAGGCTPASTCSWSWTVDGGTATTLTDAGCSSEVAIDSAGDEESVTSFEADSATVSGGTLNETLGGSEVIIYGGQRVSCTITGSRVLTAD